jgi:hypothetical protein
MFVPEIAFSSLGSLSKKVTGYIGNGCDFQSSWKQYKVRTGSESSVICLCRSRGDVPVYIVFLTTFTSKSALNMIWKKDYQ